MAIDWHRIDWHQHAASGSASVVGFTLTHGLDLLGRLAFSVASGLLVYIGTVVLRWAWGRIFGGGSSRPPRR